MAEQINLNVTSDVDVLRLRRVRASLYSKKSSLKRGGYDVTDIETTINNINEALKVYEKVQSERKKASKKKNTILANPEAQPLKYTKVVLQHYKWENAKGKRDFADYKHECITLSDVKASDLKKNQEVCIKFTLNYETKQHKIVNKVTWKFPYKKLYCLPNDILRLHNDIKNQKALGDKKFSKKEFDNREMKKKGWKIIK